MIICQPCHDQIAATRQQAKIQIFINTMFGFFFYCLGYFIFYDFNVVVYFILVSAQPCKREMNSLLQVLYHIQNTIIFIAYNLSIKVIVLPILGMPFKAIFEVLIIIIECYDLD